MALFSPISRTKILVPQRRRELLSRPRLLGLLDDLLDFKLIIVAAPAGYGKTSLMIDYATSYDWPIAWLALDSLDQNPTRFLTYFIYAIQQRFPEFGSKSISALQATREDQLNIDYLVTTITNDVLENITEHFILVLDDYHLVNQGKEIDDFLSNFLQKVSENFHLVVTSRTLLTLPDLPLLVARSQVGGLGIEELVFQPEEIKKLFEKNSGLEISIHDAELYAQQSEGWITGLLLTSQMTQEGIGDHSRVTRASGIGLYEYLAQQVLDQQNPTIQKFLLWSSMLEEFNPEMCEQIIGKALGIEHDWHTLMENIVFNNLFAIRIGEDGFWLRYHHLFRDFLQNRLEMLFPEEAHAILLNMADYYSNSEDWEHVFIIYNKIGDFVAIIKLLEKIGSSFIAKGRINQLETWFTYLPEESIRRNPQLLSIKASVEVLRGNIPQGLELQNTALELLMKEDVSKTIIAENLVRRSTMSRLVGNYNESLQDAQKALELLKNIKKNPTKAEAIREIGNNYYQQGMFEDALEWMKKSLGLYQDLNHDEDCARILDELGVIQETLGLFDEAEKTYSQSLQLWNQIGDSIWQSNLYNNLGVLQHAKGDFENSFINLEKSMDYAKLRGSRRDEGYALASIGDLYKDLDAYNESLTAYSAAMEVAQNTEDQFLILYIRLAEIRIKILQKQFKQASGLLDLAHNHARKSGSLLETELCKVEKAILKYHSGEFKDAASLLVSTREFFKSSGATDSLVTVEVYLALLFARTEQIQEASELFNEIFKKINTTANTKIISVCFELRNDLKSLSEQREISPHIDVLVENILLYQKKIQNTRRKIRQHASAIPFAAPKLIIRGFGKTEVYLNKKLITSADWTTQVSRDLFFLFLSNPEGMTKEEVGLIFWSDSSQEELKRRFKNAIYRMRRAVGSNTVIFNDNYYRFNNTLDFEYDVLSFEQSVGQAEKEKDPLKKKTLYENAIGLYKGSFLSDVNAAWFEVERQRYLEMYLNSLQRLYEIYVAENSLEKALEVLKLTIQNEPSNEEAYRNVMSIYHEFGNTAAIIRTYEQCRQQLSHEYGLEPSAETSRHFKSLVQPNL